MRRMLLAATIAGGLVLGPVPAANATHTGCEHARTQTAHSSVPHRNEGTHHAHQSIPYCPPADAPRHRG